MKKFICLSGLLIVLVFLSAAFRKSASPANDYLSGAWENKAGTEEQVLLFADGYFTHTTYDKVNKRFIKSSGGTYTFVQNNLRLQYEFDTKENDRVGQTVSYSATVAQDKLTTQLNGKQESWNKIDAGAAANLAGLWKITARKQDGGLTPIHQSGTRKTVKILTPTRFQWAAIDPGTKQFMGTGGGTYTFRDGKYTEHIEFFSRDSSRVGSSLAFDGKLENGDWHHSGLSSRGDPIYEVWSRRQQATDNKQ
jgi:hypothetical protein